MVEAQSWACSSMMALDSPAPFTWISHIELELLNPWTVDGGGAE